MGELLTFSQSFALLSSPSRVHALRQKLHDIHRSPSSQSRKPISCMISTCHIPSKLVISGTKFTNQSHQSRNVMSNVISDSGKPTPFTIDPAGEGLDLLLDSGGSDGGGGGSGGGGDDDKNEGESFENEGGKKKGMSMSQKITLGYAALVGLGGLIGYLKGGSQKSLIAGGGSAAFLLVVYALLPSSPVFASSLGLGLSAALLVVMGSRFKNSGKIFPAGVVSLASLIMSVGYSHGIFRSSR